MILKTAAFMGANIHNNWISYQYYLGWIVNSERWGGNSEIGVAGGSVQIGGCLY